MKRLIEISAFAGLAIALHIAAFATASPQGSESQGAGGETLVSLAGASAQMAAMVQDWETPPDVEVTVPEVPAPPPPAVDTLPSISTPDAPSAPQLLPPMVPQPEQDMSAMPDIDTQPPEPPRENALTTSPRPTARPEPQQRAQPPREEQRAAGSGGGSQAGQSTSAAVSTISRGREAELMAQWGARIRPRIERRKRYPSGTRGSGQVVVALRVARGGQLVNVSIRQSSGVAAFDQAALRAVSSAGRFPAAPDELTESSYSFTLQINFSR